MSELQDPTFKTEEILPAIWITLARIYDVQLALLKEQNREAAKYIYEQHAAGKLLGGNPKLVVDYTE